MTGEHCGDVVRVHLFISGLVQGVFFRAHTTKVARSLNLSGWVRNLRDGRVEVIAEGKRSSIDEFIRWCKKGPSTASVESVEIIWERSDIAFDGFKTLY